MRKLDLSYNNPGELGARILSDGVKDPEWKLQSLRVEPAGERWLKPGPSKYSCELTIDTNTVNKNIKLSEDNRKMTWLKENQSYPDHPDRFDEWPQLLCRDPLTGCRYWEVEWQGRVAIAVSYRGIGKRGDEKDCVFGRNKQSWSLECFDDGRYSVIHNDREVASFSSVSNRVVVHVNYPAGTLSFYSVSSDRLKHLHTFNNTFTEPLYPGFRLWPDSSVALCSV
ncbi:neoverrucotoxin subunit alpha-like [Cololabis saira]|uniref:neoverrucotoxin subunit alpha-like n=1 Tax=Cololabis saira TaxID=129043 RepID=UPI002AD376D3|nr:neoverrucotoxin subunit alpha-like [Cololabis saira]